MEITTHVTCTCMERLTAVPLFSFWPPDSPPLGLLDSVPIIAQPKLTKTWISK
jgi:hypothetical protein